jgi:hypothetical protein
VRCPFATWRPLGTPGAAIIPRTVIVHSEATANGLALPRDGAPLEWHFMVRNDGSVLQHVDTERRADANNKANAFAISIETEDDGDPDREPWTDAQLWALDRLIRWCASAHGIPLRVAPTWSSAGIGYHTMFGAPSPWTPVSKTCPGRARKQQWHEVLAPRLLAVPTTDEETDDVPTAPAVTYAPDRRKWVFIRGTDDQLWANVDDTGWHPLGGVLTSAPSAAVDPENGVVVVVARGADGAVWQRGLAPGGAWDEWQSLGGRAA